MNKEFKIYFDYVTTQLLLNSMIELRTRENNRNFIKDPYYDNYVKYTPVEKHNYYSFEEWEKLSISESQLKREYTNRNKDKNL